MYENVRYSNNFSTNQVHLQKFSVDLNFDYSDVGQNLKQYMYAENFLFDN